MLVLRARLLGAHQLPARQGHDTPLSLVQLFDPETQETYKLPVEAKAYDRVAAVPPLSEVTLHLGMREVSGEGGGRSRSYRLRVIKLMSHSTAPADPASPAPVPQD